MASSFAIPTTNTTISDTFTCAICFGVLREPVQCVKNEHYFCKDCISEHLRRSKACPVCRDKLTLHTLRPISRVVANLLEQFQSLPYTYADRGCTSELRQANLTSHHDVCGYAPVHCPNGGCQTVVNRRDIESHKLFYEFRSVSCDECRETMSHRDYGKHPCLFRKELDESKRGLAEVWKVLREIQDEQQRQGEQLREIARELGQPRATAHGGHGAHPRSDTLSVVVAGGHNRSYEVFDWAAKKWTLVRDALFYDHTDGFSFVYENKVLICGGSSTKKMECLNVDRTVSSFPAQLPSAECGKGDLCGDHVVAFGESISSTSLKPPFESKLIAYSNGVKLSRYGVACLDENAVVVVGGCCKYPVQPNAPFRGTEFRQDVLLYHPTMKVVKKLAPFPYQLADMAVVRHGGKLIILGGYKKHGGISNDVLVYDVTTQQCSKLPSMLQKRSKFAAVVMRDTIVVAGGETVLDESNQTVNLKTVEYLVIGEDRWKELPQMHFERAGATACLMP